MPLQPDAHPLQVLLGPGSVNEGEQERDQEHGLRQQDVDQVSPQAPYTAQIGCGDQVHRGEVNQPVFGIQGQESNPNRS